eukprot:7567275-Pyramimonas_sp.AAC.1
MPTRLTVLSPRPCARGSEAAAPMGDEVEATACCRLQRMGTRNGRGQRPVRPGPRTPRAKIM